MMRMKQFIGALIILGILVGGGYFFVNNYDWIFARKIRGEVLGVEKVNTQMALLNTNDNINSKVFSYAVKIRDEKTGEIFSASSEDRQLAVLEKGNCAELELFPYPPWVLRKGGTWSNTRLIKIYDCPNQAKE